jgi:hypothetical protein
MQPVATAFLLVHENYDGYRLDSVALAFFRVVGGFPATLAKIGQGSCRSARN